MKTPALACASLFLLVIASAHAARGSCFRVWRFGSASDRRPVNPTSQYTSRPPSPGRRWRHAVALAAAALATGAMAADPPVSLAGEWRFQLDRQDAGETEKWFSGSLAGRVRLPGGLAEQGIGDPPGPDTPWTGSIQNPKWASDPALARYATVENFKFPYWLTPERHYVGVAWFQREIDIPATWTGRRIVLTLERPHWETRVWIDGTHLGSNNALGTPHEYVLGRLAAGKHRLTIRVDNRLVVDVGKDSHSVSDHTQGNWIGIVGRLELRATPEVWIDDLQAHPDAPVNSVRVRGRIGNDTGKPATVRLRVSLAPSRDAAAAAVTEVEVACPTGGREFETEVKSATAVERWDEFTPRLYRLTAELAAGAERDARSVVCGFRELAIAGTQFLVNGRKTFFRGTLECAIFPKTGHPPTDVDSWRKVIRAAQAHGLNLLRFHSWCPPEAAFVAADELGMYLHVECSSWANHGSTLGDDKPVDAWIYAEAERILKHYGSHPSFVMLMYGNEPGGKNHRAYLTKWVEHVRARDPRRWYGSGAGWPQLPVDQFFVAPEPRIQRWGEGLKSRINARPPDTMADYREYIASRRVPVISHEIGQWCVYPNFGEMAKYTGYLKPRNFEIFRDRLNARGMGDQAAAFLHASGRLQTLCYKEDIEAALRTPGMGGFQLLDLHDFPGQGTALVGVLDPFWEEKGYVAPEEYRRFCNRTVLLARLPRRVFTTDDTLEAALEIAHFGPTPLADAVVEWQLRGEDGRPVARGELSADAIPVDNGTALGRVTQSLRQVAAPARYRLVAALRGTDVANDWDVWVYPKAPYAAPASDRVAVVSELDAAAEARLRAGGKVLWLVPPARVANAASQPVVLGFSAIFWNTAWTRRQPPTTLGILCEPRHPALALFPTETHSNWQWWYVIRHAAPMILDDLPLELRPVVQVIDDWVTARRLGLVFEARVGGGKLLVCSVDLGNGADTDPVRRQLRASLQRYLAGDAFQPRSTVTMEKIRRLVTPAAASP